jgi:hypothetical protein
MKYDRVKIASIRAKVTVPLAGIGQWMLNWSGKVRLDKVYLGFKDKNTAIIYFVFSQGLLEFNYAYFLI